MSAMTLIPRILPCRRTTTAEHVRGLRPAGRPADASGMPHARLAARIALLACLALSGCLMPNRGTPVFVDARTGDYWSGKGLLLTVSPDRTQCQVAVRDRALFVRERWVPCSSVHERPL